MVYTDAIKQQEAMIGGYDVHDKKTYQTNNTCPGSFRNAKAGSEFKFVQHHYVPFLYKSLGITTILMVAANREPVEHQVGMRINPFVIGKPLSSLPSFVSEQATKCILGFFRLRKALLHSLVSCLSQIRTQ